MPDLMQSCLGLLLPLSIAVCRQDAEEVDVVIIGAGYSGLAAALTLQKANVSFRLLEAQQRVGGRALNRIVGSPGGEDDVIEVGGEWLAPQHVHALTLFHELGFSKFKRPYNFETNDSPVGPPCEGECSIRVRTQNRGWQQAATQSQVMSLFSSDVQLAINRTAAAILHAAAHVPCDAPLTNPESSYYDSISFDAYLRQFHDRDSEAYNWLTGFADDAEDIRQVSALAVFWVQNCSGGVVNSVKEDLWRVRGGTQGPAQKLAAGMRLQLQLGARVSDIISSGPDKFTVVSTRGVVMGRHVLIAGLSAPLVLGIHFHPPLPADVAQLFQRYPLGTSLKYSLVFKSPWWRARGFLGKILFLNGTSSGSTFTGECLDNSPYSWSRGVIMCFVEGAQNRAFEQLSALQRRSAMLNVLQEAFGEQHEDELEEVVEHNWASDEFSRGAYSSFHMPGIISDFWEPLSRIYHHHKLGPSGLWIAGADYSMTGLGYIDGAIKSGEKAAAAILGELRGGMRMNASGLVTI